MYQALYRKWRPRTFDDVVGQAHITDTLKRQVAAGRLSHAYLFTGTRGTGKTSCAKILAKAVNCQDPQDGNPCNHCAACTGIDNGSILDVLELDAASNNGVDQVRALRDEAVYTPAAVRKRVYIIDEVHMLSTPAFNALLKILEEPPAHLMFILATTELHKVPATIKSRCQQFSFKRISTGDISRRLSYVAEQEGIGLTAGGAELLSRLADGGLRDALSLLDQCVNPGGTIGEEEVLAALGLAGNLETARLMEQIAAGDTAAALETLSRLYQNGKDVGVLLEELSGLARDLLVRKTAPKGGAALLTGGYDETTMRRLSGMLEPGRLMQMLTQLQQTGAELARSGSRRTAAELCLMRLCDPRLDGSPAGLNARIARLEALLEGGAPAVPAKEREREERRTELSTPAPRRTARKKTAPEPAPPPMAEERPPWEEEEQPPLPEEPGEPTLPEEPVPDPPQPAKRARAKTTPGAAASAPAGQQGGAPADFWSGLVQALHGKVGAGVYPYLSNPEAVQGRLTGEKLTLWVDSEFTRMLISRPNVLAQVARAAESILGHPVHCTAAVGSAPAPGGDAPGAPAPAAAPAAETDALDDLVEAGRGFDNVTIR